jgi:hypothetical protein
MVYIEVITIQGKKYKYLRMSVRMGKKMKKITLRCLGAVNPIYHKKVRKRRSNASIYTRQITEKEKIELTKALHSSNVFVRDRAKIFLLSAEKTSPVAIALKISCEARKVRIAIKAFNNEGLKALERKKARGAIPKFTEFDKKAILLHFSKNPREFGYPISAWTLPRFRKHLIEKRVADSIGYETVRRILLNAGAKLNQSKRWQYSPDKNFLRKKEQ